MDDAQTLQSRLTQFAVSHSRAEIARKTGTSVMNVGRYLKGTRVPAEFCMALVREFGVNSNWLLAGQGGPFVSDLATQHGQMAGNLLELVEAMSAVAKMRLGSIAGQDHMKLLRQLNDSLGTYERLRAKLNDQGRGILADVLHELQGALASMDMARSGALRKAAEQVARLCDDDELTRRLLGMQAHHSYLSGRVDEAIALMRKQFTQLIGSGRIESDEQAQSAQRLVLLLHDSGRITEAMAMGRAFMELAGADVERLPSIANIGAFAGTSMGERGHVREALDLLQRWTPLVHGRMREVALAGLVQAQLLAGVLTFEQALAAPGLPQPKHAHILGLAIATENAPVIRACMKFLDTEAGREVKERTLAPHYAPLLARAIERGDKQTAREFAAKRSELEARPHSKLEIAVYEAQLARVLGDTKRASKLVVECEKAMQAMPERANLNIVLRAVHARNQLNLGYESEGSKALQDLIDSGCRLFKPLVT